VLDGERHQVRIGNEIGLHPGRGQQAERNF
jgi:hypothetical protein